MSLNVGNRSAVMSIEELRIQCEVNIMQPPSSSHIVAGDKYKRFCGDSQPLFYTSELFYELFEDKTTIFITSFEQNRGILSPFHFTISPLG